MTRNAESESTTTVASFEEYAPSRLMSKKIWRNEKKLKKERKRYYAALAEEVGESRKENGPNPCDYITASPSTREQEAPAWFHSAMEKVQLLSPH